MNVFVSFQTPDVEPAQLIKCKLASRGHSVVLFAYDVDDPVTMIASKLRLVDLILLIVGPATHESVWVGSEVFAGQVLCKPMIAILLDSKSPAPKTLPLKTPVITYQSLVETEFGLFDHLPSDRMREEQWRNARIKIWPYRCAGQDRIPPPVIDRASILNGCLLVTGLTCATAGYLAGFFGPPALIVWWFIPMDSESNQQAAFWEIVRGSWIFLIWSIVFTLILFYKPRQRLTYPLWILWFFRQYLPAWLSTRSANTTKVMEGTLKRLADSPGNQAFWEREQAWRRGAHCKMADAQYTEYLFGLLLQDERKAGPYGEFDRKGLSEIYDAIRTIPEFDVGVELTRIEHGPDDVEIIRRDCPAPFCLCGKSVRLKKVGGRWQVVHKNW